MHIAILVQDFLPETGAGPARIAELSAEWLAAGHKVSVVTAFPSRRLAGQRDGTIPAEYRGRVTMHEEMNGVHVHRSWLYTSPKRGFLRTLVNNLSFTGTSLVNALRSLRDVDVIIASGPPYFSQFAGALTAGFRGVPLVVEIRDLWPDYLAEMGVVKQRWLLKSMFATERWLLRRAASVTVVTESFKQRIIEKGIAADLVDVIPNGVDTGRYFPSRERCPLEGVDGPEDGPLVGYLGTFGAGQGLAAVIEAARIVRTQNDRVRFALVGDGPERAALEAILKAKPVPGLALYPPVPRDATRALYNSCDVVLVPHASLPVLGATVPSKIFEVMACGRPLVAALRGEGARIVEASRGGVLATPGDAVSIASAINQVLAMSADQRDEMGRAGRDFASGEYDRSALARRYLKRLESLVAVK